MKIFKKVFIVFALIIAVLLNNYQVYANAAKVRIPTAPTALTYSGVTSSEVTLSWQAVSGVTGYNVYRATTNDSNHALIATISTTSYKNSSLVASTKYWYYVKAYNSRGMSAASTHISITTAVAVPSATPTPVVTPVPTPSPTPVVTSTPKKIVLGFATYYYSGDSSSYNSMMTNGSTIDEIATHTYITDAYGNISGLLPTNQITYANNNNIKTLAMVSNNFDGAIAHTLLTSPTNRQALINNTLNALKLNGYKGVNVDLEGVYYYDRAYLTTFMSELYTTLHTQGFYVTMAVPAKTIDSLTNSWTGAFDYAALAKYTDQMVLMTYDEHYPGGTPGAVASIGWVENVIKYTVTVVPKEKILLGTPAYGYDWSVNGTKAYGITAAYNLAAANNTLVNWDSISKTPYFNYTDTQGVSHSVWFENAQSLDYKLNLVNSYDIAGIAIWRLGFEDAAYWTSIKTKFNR